MKDLIKKLLRENLLLENISDIAYHFNHTNRTIQILETNKINLAAAFGTPSDNIMNKGKLFYLSTTSSRSTDVGYAGSLGKHNLVRLTLDGRALSHNYEITRVDYWQRPKDPRHPTYNPHDEPTGGKSFYKNISRQDELEDRLISDKNEIKPANRYIITVEVLNGEEEELQYMKHLCENLNIPFYAYDNEAYFNASAKNKTINVSSANTPREKNDRSNYFNTDLIAYLGFKDEALKEKILNNLEKLGVEDIDRIRDIVDTRINDKLKYYLRPRDTYYLNDFANSMSSGVHNAKSSTNEIERYLIRELGLDMKRNNVTSIKDYLTAKTWKGKKRQSDFNKEFNYNVMNFIDTQFKENIESTSLPTKSFEVNGDYYENIFEYPPINDFINNTLNKIKKYYSNYILNNDDMYRYNYVLSRDEVTRNLNLGTRDFENYLNPILNDIDFIGSPIESKDFYNLFQYYLLSDLDQYQYNEAKRLQAENQEQLNR